MKDVAAIAGVDTSVVSRLLNDDPRLSISAPTRQRVLDAIATLNYRRNPAARALRTSKTRLVAVLLPSLTNPIYAELIAGVEERASKTGYGVVLADPTQMAADPDHRADLAQRVDGLIVAGGTIPENLLKTLQALDLAVVIANRKVRGAWCVLADDTAGTRLAARHLLDLGHRHCAVLLGSSKDGVGGARLREFTRIVEQQGGRVQHVVAPGWDARAGHDAISELAIGPDGPTAVFAVNMMLAIGAISAWHRNRVKVPRDVSLVALHDADLAEFMVPPLTTVRLPMAALGAASFDRLIARLDGAPAGSVMVVDPPVLTIRASTARRT